MYPGIVVEKAEINSLHLSRKVTVDFYLPQNVVHPDEMSLLLVNDGQDLVKMNFQNILEKLYSDNDRIRPVFCAAVHCSADRKLEYGVAGIPDFANRGNKADVYTSFILKELLPYIRHTYHVYSFRENVFAGFSLGGLSALDIVWNYPGIFNKAGVFSGSLWWRSVDQTEKEYDDDRHRIMHQRIRNGVFNPGQQFFFQCGNMDETADRNYNGIIDSIEDTLDIITELAKKGYDKDRDICYVEYADGKHDVDTWARAIPEFMKWGFSY
ncbi:MAG: esterase [Chitinophagaceae bacterium]|nr:esterase [Chitinophagaceae bacterium]